MTTIDLGGRELTISGGEIIFGSEKLLIDEIEGLRVIRTDKYVNGAWVKGTRIILLRSRHKRLTIDCSAFLPRRDQLDRSFGSAMETIWQHVGNRLAGKFVHKILEGHTIDVGPVRVSADGVWVDGNWRFLWWKAKPRFVPWPDTKIFSHEGTLFIGSATDQRFKSEVDINKTENALILDGLVRTFIGREIDKASHRQQ